MELLVVSVSFYTIFGVVVSKPDEVGDFIVFARVLDKGL